MFYSGKLNKGETSVTNTGEHATSIAMLGGMILFGLTTIATARKMRR